MKYKAVDETPKVVAAQPRATKVKEISGPSKDEIRKKLSKMFRAACNGKRYFERFFPGEFKDTGDFEAEFNNLLNKL